MCILVIRSKSYPLSWFDCHRFLPRRKLLARKFLLGVEPPKNQQQQTTRAVILWPGTDTHTHGVSTECCTSTTKAVCKHWRRQLWGTGARTPSINSYSFISTPVDFQQFISSASLWSCTKYVGNLLCEITSRFACHGY